MWILVGFVYGFVVFSEYVEFFYKIIDFWVLEYECCIVWNDFELKIDWLLQDVFLFLEKDCQGKVFVDVDCFF